MVSTELQAMRASVVAKFDAAINEALNNEADPPVVGRPDICALISILKTDLGDKIEELEELETIIPCGQ